MKDLLLIAASGLAREVIAAVRAADSHRIIGILDDSAVLHGTDVDGVQVAGALETVPAYPEAELLMCMGKGISRETAVERLKRLGIGQERYATVAHPSASIAAGCTIGAGTILLANVTLTADVQLGSHVVAMPHVTFTHDNVVCDYATFAAGVSLGGYVHIGQGAYLGMNSSVRERLQVGRNATLGMGAALINDLPANQSWVGVPARPAVREVWGRGPDRHFYSEQTG